MKKQQSKRVIPGFGLTMGVTLAMLSIIVLIPLASLAVYSARLGFREFIEVITRPRVLSGFYVSFITAFAATVINAIMGLVLAWVLVRYDFPGKRIMDGMIELPFALPTAVAGISLTSSAGNAFRGGTCLRTLPGRIRKCCFYRRKQTLLYRDHAADHYVKASGV